MWCVKVWCVMALIGLYLASWLFGLYCLVCCQGLRLSLLDPLDIKLLTYLLAYVCLIGP
jgi:hypothetical protein